MFFCLVVVPMNWRKTCIAPWHTRSACIVPLNGGKSECGNTMGYLSILCGR